MPIGIYERTKEHKEKIRLSNLGKHNNGLTYEEVYGAVRAKAIKEKLRLARTGCIVSDTTKAKLSEQKLGDKNPAKQIDVREKLSLAKLGKSYEEIHGKEKAKEKRLKMSKSMVGKNTGANSGRWRGGISLEPYGMAFSKELKFEIRQRDMFLCQLCGIPEGSRHHTVHHVDYAKKNNDKFNLITLCKGHNSLANGDRDKWQFLFETLQEIRLAT